MSRDSIDNSTVPPFTLTRSFFHLLVPATSTNSDLCKLQLSITALGYPAPIFINWNADDNASHLTKVTGLLRYLRGFSSAHDNDIALIVDGFDIWFQLRPDVMLQRYFEVISAANKRVEERLRKALMEQHGIYQSIIFGPDKICWPEIPSRAACWAVPNSTLPYYAFGPETDSGRFRDQYRPRWLNSGTIMGPVNDVRDLLAATVERIEVDYTTDSDQFYISELFGLQEYARTLLVEGPMPSRMRRKWITDGWFGEGHFENVLLAVPKPGEEEYHITVDYESALFQTMSYTTQFLSWIQYDEEHTSSLKRKKQQLILPIDIEKSAPPFPHHFPPASNDTFNFETLRSLSNSTWQNIPLGTNAISNRIFPLLHFTGDKHYRESWWNRMWFTPYAEEIIKAAPYQPIVALWTDDAGTEWWGYDPSHLLLGHNLESNSFAAGGWSDNGTFVSWTEFCGAHEDAVFKGLMDVQETPYDGIHHGELKGVKELGLPSRPVGGDETPQVNSHIQQLPDPAAEFQQLPDALAEVGQQEQVQQENSATAVVSDIPQIQPVEHEGPEGEETAQIAGGLSDVEVATAKSQVDEAAEQSSKDGLVEVSQLLDITSSLDLIEEPPRPYVAVPALSPEISAGVSLVEDELAQADKIKTDG